MVKMGISAVDTEGAKKNLEAEIPSWEFEQVRSNARQAWNNYLSKIDITTQDETDRSIFYTAMYHTAISPNLFTDVDGRYWGMDLKVHQAMPTNRFIRYSLYGILSVRCIRYCLSSTRN